MSLRHTLCAMLAAGTLLLAVDSASAQTNFPRGPLPNSIRLKKADLTFGGGINIFVVPEFADFVREVQKIKFDWNMARQQVALSSAYLLQNKKRILAGLDPLYNQMFGGYYDRSNRFFGTYEVNESHFQRVLGTFSRIRDRLESPAFFDTGNGAIVQGLGSTGNRVLGIDRGIRQWGFSNSSSLAKHDQFFANPANSNSVRWDADDNGFVAVAATEPARRRFAATNLFQFRNSKLEVYEDGNNNFFIGGVFRNARTGNGDFDVDVEGASPERLDDPNVVFRLLGNRFANGPPRWNSGNNLTFNDPDDFGQARYYRYQYLIQNLSEFTTDLSDVRGGAFFGFTDMLRAFSSTQDEFENALLNGLAFDAENYGLFGELLNANGFTDVRSFPSRGKNAQFSPGVPAP